MLDEFNEFRSLQLNCTKYLFRTLSVSSSSSSPSLSSREEGRVLSCDVLVVTTRLQSLWKNMKTSVRAPNCHLLNYDCFQDKWKTKEIATNWNQSLLCQNSTVLSVCLSNFSTSSWNIRHFFTPHLLAVVYFSWGCFFAPILKTFKGDLLTRKYGTGLITRKLSVLNSKCFEQQESLPCR